MAKPAENLPSGITVMYFGKDKERWKYRLRINYKGRQHSAGLYETLSEAKEAKKEFNRRVLLGTFVPAREQYRRWRLEREARDRQKVTVADYSRTWIEELGSGRKPRTAATLVAYQNTLDVHILPAFANTYLADLKQEQVDKLLEMVEEASGPAAARNVARTLRAMFNHAVAAKAGGLTKAPFKVTVRKSPVKTAEEIPTPQDVTAISAAMPEDLQLAPVLAALCALRPAETLGLQRRDIDGLDGQKPTLTIARQWIQKQSPPDYGPPKYDSVRTVGIPKTIVPALKKHLTERVGSAPEAPLFASRVNPTKPIGATTYREAWNRATRTAGRPHFVLHSLRHLGLTMFAVAGGTNAEVMARGGHKDLEAAARYQHSLKAREWELTDALSKEWETKE